jgi:RNA polymerase sigma-70 factor (ECF subfamily)
MEDNAQATTAASIDEQLVTRVLSGDVSAFAALMRRYNRRLFRVVRSIVRDDAEAEDVCQETWLRGYRHLEDLADGAKFSTWLARIGWRFALARVEQHAGIVSLDERDLAPAGDDANPEGQIDLQRMVEKMEDAIDDLPPAYRAVVLLRDVEHMSTSEVADVLELSEENVRVRLHRARSSLRQQFVGSDDVFRFDGDRCARLTRAVLARVFATRAADDQSDSRYATRSSASPAASSSPSTLS